MSDVFQGQNAEILQATIDGTPYTEMPESYIAQLLLELKEVIEQGGGGGGGTTNYNGLTNKPQINNVVLQGNKSLSDLGIINIIVDAALSGTSENPVQNKVVKAALDAKQGKLVFDNEPTQNSNNPVKSGGIYTALLGKQNTLTFDTAPKAGSTNPVTSQGILTALDAKQNTLTFDSAPTAGSSNPVTSGGIKTAFGNYYDKDEVNTIIGGLMTLSYAVVQTLPTEDIDTHTIYLVPDAQSANVYDEYLYIDNQWASLGSTEVDLSNYYTKTQTDTLLDEKQDVLTIDSDLSITSENPVQNKVITLSLGSKLSVVQTMGTASAALLGAIVLYDGATDANFTKGNVYECQLVPDSDPAEYEWVDLSVQLDNALSSSSENGVQNKVIYEQIYQKLYSTIAGIAQNNKGSMELYSKDLNTITTTGFYNAMTCTNAPYTYMILIVCGYYLDGYCFQLAADINTGSIKTRVEYGGTWGDWTDDILDVVSTKQAQTLTTPVVVDGSQKTTVETALAAINTSKDKRLLVTDTMPTASEDYVSTQRLYVGDTTAAYTKGVVYECQQVPESDPAVYKWVGISSAEVDLSNYQTSFTGTKAQWDALTSAQKALYNIVYITDDNSGITLDSNYIKWEG